MLKMVILFILFCSLPVQAKDQILKFETFYSSNSQGFIQVREGSLVGKKLDLPNNLGLSNMIGLTGGYAIKLESIWLDFDYTQFIISGQGHFDGPFNFNGATYTPGKTKIGKTNYRRYDLLIKRDLAGERGSTDNMMIGGGISLETMRFYISGDLDPSTNRFEKFESFDSQQVPVPTLEWLSIYPYSSSIGYGLDLMGSWLPKSKTPYNEGGPIYFQQKNLDGKILVLWAFDKVQCNAGYRWKYFYQREESREDDNEFRIMSSGLFFDINFIL